MHENRAMEIFFLMDFVNFIQGSNADYRGHVLGVIGDVNAPLSKVGDHVIR